MTIGESIREARLKKGWTQKQLGDKCNMADSAIRRYESDRGNPTIETLKRIANALEVDPYSLMDFDMATAALEDQINSRAKHLLTFFDQLNEEGQAKAVERVEELTEIPKYQKKPPQD